MARADAGINTRAFKNRPYAFLRRLPFASALVIAVIAVSAAAVPLPAAAQQQLGTPAGEKASKRIGGLPDIFGKQSNDGEPVMQRRRVMSPPEDETAKEAAGEDENGPSREEREDKDRQDDNKKEAASETGEKETPDESKAAGKTESAPKKQSRVYKRLGGMGVDAEGLENAVFLRPDNKSRNEKEAE